MKNAVRIALPLAVVVGLAAGCGKKEETAKTTFYERKISPVLVGSCATSPTQSSCHVAADDRGNALGNLNVSSYDTLSLRRDLLINYGPYGLPDLLLKVVPAFDLQLTAWDGTSEVITTDVAHAGGSLLDFTSVSYNQLARWIENGAAENNAPAKPKQPELTPCTESVGTDPNFDPNVDPGTPDYGQFVQEVNPVLGQQCAAGNCHGSGANSLYLTCGKSPEQKRWNYFVASDYVSTDAPASEILRRALDPAQGGTYHEGGVIFTSTSDDGYKVLLNWAVARGGPNAVPTDAGFDMFAKRVQPMLVKRGCMQIQCHSASIFHDYRLRGGSGGHFGLPATRRNYELTLEQVSLESPDPNASRIIRKNLQAPGGAGILHRGGSLFAQDGDPSQCDLVAAETGPLNDQKEYCVIVAWLEKERQARMAGAVPLSSVVYVKRPPASGKDVPQDYGSYNPGADLMQTPVSMDAAGDITSGGGGTSLLGGCGLSPSTADVRRPAVSWDGTKIAFAARSSASEPFKIYVIDNGNCAAEPTINAPATDDSGAPVPDNGELVHNFDPAFAPDGRIVFASTRGNTKNVKQFPYSGPTRTPADPSKLNSNLYVLENGKIRQLTFLLNQEFMPNFMSDGRVIMITEKRAPGFYQLAARRQNLDGGDYHPLFGQRQTIGYDQLTDVVELSDKNFAAIFSDKGAAHGGGTLAVFNRSLGPDQLSQNPDDYTQDPDGMSWPNPKFYQHSIEIVDPAATGKAGGTTGAYRNPASLPNGKILVSYAANVVDVENFSGNFDLVVVDPITRQRTPLISDADDLIWPVAVYARQNHGVFKSRLDEANGATTVYTDAAHADRSEITFVDFPLITSLLFQNTRTGRVLPGGNYPYQAWESLPPDPGVTSYDQGGDYVTNDAFGQLYVKRRLRGAVNLLADGSSKVQLPGGMPLVLATNVKLAADSSPVVHFQREEMQFYPGEWVRQSFRRELFNGLCAGCHGSLSGYESHISVNPDILTQASNVDAREADPIDVLSLPIGDPKGPPFD
ncbi:MAG: PD40 domain-containing protein [Myxococcales bacterium]|nr:PD40 domain-containing protein [Myxococcales bacterium]MCB9580338.1 PD40 domain-containing protein [Polyangiaceae bacterium]